MISILSSIFGSTLSLLLGNSLKSMVKSSVLHTGTFREVVSSISKIIVLLITMSIIISSIVLLICYGLNFFLLDIGFTFFQSIFIIIALKIIILGMCVKKVKCSIDHLNNNIGEELPVIENEDKFAKSGFIQNTFSSFIDGFNSIK